MVRISPKFLCDIPVITNHTFANTRLDCAAVCWQSQGCVAFGFKEVDPANMANNCMLTNVLAGGAVNLTDVTNDDLDWFALN